jgi:mono/diheme cytochrome c family protein
MKRNRLIALAAMSVIFTWSCNSGSNQGSGSKNAPGADSSAVKKSTYADDTKGIGKFKDVPLTHPLDQSMIASAQKIFDLKCSACHRLTSEKLVGPGWKGVTDRRKPEWIMNFVTNTDEMINKDPNAQALLEQCMVRMPNQNLTDADARAMVEFMRKNDGKN